MKQGANVSWRRGFYLLNFPVAFAKCKVNKSLVLIFCCGFKTICLWGPIMRARTDISLPHFQSSMCDKKCFPFLKEQRGNYTPRHCFCFWSQYLADLWEKHLIKNLRADSLGATGQNWSKIWITVQVNRTCLYNTQHHTDISSFKKVTHVGELLRYVGCLTLRMDVSKENMSEVKYLKHPLRIMTRKRRKPCP